MLSSLFPPLHDCYHSGMTPFRQIPVLLLAALALRAAGARDLEPQDIAETWRWRKFDREDGIPSGWITALGYGRGDDHVYVASARGILRYDGFTWKPLATGEPFDGPIEKIVEAG
jgi:hypothetical protein